MTSTRTMVRDDAAPQAWGWDGPSLGDAGLAGADPLGFAGGDVNLYRYVGNSPTNYTDPSGLSKVRLIYKLGEQVVKVRDLPEEVAKKILRSKTKNAGEEGVRVFVQTPQRGGRNTAKQLAEDVSPAGKAVGHPVDRHGHPSHYHPVTGHSQSGVPRTDLLPEDWSSRYESHSRP